MLRDYKLSLKQDVPHVLSVEGDFYRILKAESGIGLIFDESVVVNREQGMGGTQKYQRVTIISPKDQVVTISLGFGVLYDDRGANVSSLPTCSPYYLDVPVQGDESVLLLPESEFRYSATLSIPRDFTGGVRIACNSLNADTPSGVNVGQTFSDHGVWLYGGGTMSIQTRTAIYCTNRSGISVNVAVLALGCDPQYFVM